MYIREKKTDTTPALQLVSGARGQDGKVRQKIILSLGNVPIPDELRKTIAHEVENRMNGYQRLMALDLEVAKWVDHILEKLDSEGNLPPVRHHELKRVSKMSIDGVMFDKIEHEDGTLLGAIAATGVCMELAWDRQFSERI